MARAKKAPKSGSRGGFAIGLERFIAQLTGAQNIREVALFPRDMSRLTP